MGEDGETKFYFSTGVGRVEVGEVTELDINPGCFANEQLINDVEITLTGTIDRRGFFELMTGKRSPRRIDRSRKLTGRLMV